MSNVPRHETAAVRRRRERRERIKAYIPRHIRSAEHQLELDALDHERFVRHGPMADWGKRVDNGDGTVTLSGRELRLELQRTGHLPPCGCCQP